MKLSVDAMQHPANWPDESDWTTLLEPSFRSDEFRELSQFLTSERQSKTIFPVEQKVFNAFRFCSFEQTKVVVLGQDPYHGDGQAHGLSFSVQGTEKLPPSLKNIFKELNTDVGCERQHGDLTRWAQQGVLLLNTVLTVERGNANSHRKRGWEQFTDCVIQKLGTRKKPIVFILWGAQAAQKSNLVEPHHTIIQSPHPSPLSSYRGFFGSRPFSKCNKALSSFGLTPIDWKL